jgi:glycosyltransferase involved in cell wall biosynthesis
MSDARPISPLHVGMGWFPDQIGGLNRYLRDLYEAQVEAGARPRAIVLGPAAVPPGVTVAARHTDRLPKRLKAMTEAIRREVAGTDVVDIHFAVYGLLALAAGRLDGRPLVVHFQGPWADESRAVGASPTEVRVKRALEKWVYRRADRLVVLSPRFRDVLVRDYGVLSANVDVIPPGVDVEAFRPGDRDAARAALGLDGAPVVFAARRLVPRMGLEDAVAALARSRHAGAVLVIAGDGPHRDALAAAARAHGVADRVRLLGRVSDEDLVRWYQAADCVVVPSRELEGFGLVALEALACGAPVVATDEAGAHDAVARLDPELVVPARAPAALATAVDRVLDGAGPSRAACRELAEQHRWADVVHRLNAVYERAGAVRTLKVVYLDHCAQLSGAELALARLLPALPDVRAHVILAEDGPLAARLREGGATVEVLPLRERTRSLRKDRVTGGLSPLALADTARYVLRLARRLRELKPDLVHGNSLKACMYGSAAAALARLPFVWHARDRISPDYLPPAALRAVHAAVRHLPDTVIANSRATYDTLGFTGPGRVVASPVINDPLESGLGDARDTRSDDVFVVGVVGRLAPWKGQDVFLEAFARAFAGGGERARVIGQAMFGEDGYAASLPALAERLGIADRVEFRGFRADVGLELAQLDALVHCSVIPEPFGQVVVEGMAAGLPVVAMAAGGPLEVVDDGVNGLLVEPRDVDGLATAMRRLRDDRALRRSLAEAARKTAEQYRPAVIGEQIEGVYFETLRRRRQRRWLRTGAAS